MMNPVMRRCIEDSLKWAKFINNLSVANNAPECANYARYN